MREILNNIDVAKFEISDAIRYHIGGWILLDESKRHQLKVIADHQVNIPFEIEWKERPDIIEVLKGAIIPEKPGFSIYIENMQELADKYQSLEVCIADNNEQIIIFEKEIALLWDEYRYDVIIYNVEKVDLWRDQITIQGWGFEHDSENELNVQLVDDQGQILEFRNNQVLRLDVNKHYNLNTDIKIGFNISVKRENVKTGNLYVRFGSEEYHKDYIINMKAFDAEHSQYGRLKKALENKTANKEYIRKNGWKAFYQHIKCVMDPWYADYNMWVQEHSVSSKELRTQKKTKFDYEPIISIIIPLYNTPLNYLQDLMDSLVYQSYEKIEICLADGSTKPEVGEFIHKKYGKDARVRYEKLAENKGISENTNAALKMATGDYIMLSDHDDIVTRDAVYEIVKAINKNPETVDIVYTDEDKITMDGKNYFEPNMKPDFNRDLLRANNYICHIFAVRKSIMDEIEGFRSEYDGAQDYDLILRCCEKAQDIVHVPKVLYHWRSHPASTADNPASKMYAFEAGRKALQGHYDRVGVEATALITDVLGRYRTKYKIQGNPKISIIIPNKDHVDDLKKCLESIWTKTTYDNYEIIVVENNSTEPKTFQYYKEIEPQHDNLKVIVWKDIFNYAAINNYAVQSCTGEYLLFLNNDIEIITEDWLEEMLGYCQQPEVGAVGAKLYFPDDTVQHAGVIIGMGGVAGHIFSGTPRVEYGYQAKLISPQNLSAVTAACMMVKASVFEEVGGFDDKFKVAFNDIDLCMKIRAAGNLIVFTPYAELYHYESKSRGKEETQEQLQRFHNEVHLFEEKWSDILKNGDPYYSPNLSLEDGNCSLRWESKKYN